MASPSRRIQQSYVNGAGASGGLLALALIGFIGLIGLISFSAWPQSHGSAGQSVNANLPPAKAAPSSGPRPTAPPQPVIAHLQHRVATQPSVAGQRPGRRAQKHARADGGHAQPAPAPPSSRAQQTTGGPGNSENAPGHNKVGSSTETRNASGPGKGRGVGRSGELRGASNAAPGHGHGRGHAYGHSKAH